MLKLEDQVCNVELAKMLKTLGVKQTSVFYWVSYYDVEVSVTSPVFGLFSFDDTDKVNAHFSAFTVSELGEMLPTQMIKQIKWFDIYFLDAFGDAVDETDPIVRFTDKKEADARAKMLIYLIEIGVVKP